MSGAVTPGGDSAQHTPPLGHRALTPLYDFAIASLTREKTWRKALVAAISPQPDDRILVSGAAGGVGSHVAAIAKALGAGDVVGVAGGAEKCRRLRSEMAYDHVIDYKNEDVDRALSLAFPKGIDLYFDNVGGPFLDNVLGRLRRRARIVICGAISEYLVDTEIGRAHV